MLTFTKAQPYLPAISAQPVDLNVMPRMPITRAP
jgi:hypothetical protein